MDIKEKIEMILPFNLKRLRFEKINFNDFLLLREEMKLEPMSLLSCRPINDKSEENLESYFEEMMEQKNSFIFSIYSLEDNSLLGRFSIFDFNLRNKALEIGFFLLKPYRRLGYAEEMVEGIKKNCFEILGINKISAQTGAFNRSSIALLEKSEFQRDGILREHHEINGELFDDYIYSFLRKDY